MSNFKRASMAGAGPKSASSSSAMAAGGNKNSILNALRATTMVDSKPVLPAEILVTILDYLPVSDLLRFARTSRRMREMVYDDTRWVARLRSMGVWDEAEARRRFEEVMKRRREAAERAERERLAAAAAAGRGHNVIPGQTQHLFPGLQQQVPPPVITTTLFDAGEEEQRRKRLQEEQQKREQAIREAAQRKAMEEMDGLQDGFETMKVGGIPGQQGGGLLTTASAHNDPFSDPEALLNVIKNARSIRGHARQEYGKIYGALAPFYFDLAKAKSHTDPVVFRVFRDPERQAQMLANLRTFAKSDWAAGWRQREEKLATMAGIFESAVLHEFETGYEFWDVDERMHKYAHVLDLLNGGTAAVELFIQKHPIFSDKEVLANPMDCVNQALADDVTLEPSRRFFEVLTLKVNEQADIISRVFPKPAEVFWLLIGKIRDDILTDYVTPLFDETHERSLAAYVKAVSGLFEQTLQFFRTVNAPKDEGKNQEELAKEYALKVFEQHLDLYLADELDYFTKQAEAEVAEWDKKLSEQDATAESFYMGSFTNRQADKKDFLTSFKKVVMMPVSVLPSLPLGSPFASSKPATTPTTATTAAAKGGELQAPESSELSRSASPSLTAPVIADRTGSPLPDKAPTDELAAKAALMTSRLEGIKSLFSIEVALSLVHDAKSSLGRAAVFIQLGGQAGGEAREQCEAIFVALLRILGGRHIKPGFDKAVAHLSQYNPREVSHHDKGGVAPLVTFIELVNVGDLISQMIDVFYEQQLTTPKIADRNDFLDPAGLAKKKFEQMLDESVAAGLNKGIDVLMDEVEYVCATTQLPTDYNPTMTTDPFNDAASISGMSTTTEGTTNTSSSGSNNRKSRYKSGTPSIWSLPSLPGTPTTPGGSSSNTNSSLGPQDIGPTATALRIRDLVASHTSMLTGSTDKSMLDVFNGEVGLRLFAAVCKHLKRQRISTEGAIKLIADVNLYYEYIRTLKNNDLLAYFKALRELSQIYLIDAKHHAKEMATIIADNERFSGVFRAEEVYEYAERRADWYSVRKEVERAMYGLECVVM